MRLTYKQLATMLDHADSPYIPAVGLLYVRYVVDPKEAWGFYNPKVKKKDLLILTLLTLRRRGGSTSPRWKEKSINPSPIDLCSTPYIPIVGLYVRYVVDSKEASGFCTPKVKKKIV